MWRGVSDPVILLVAFNLLKRWWAAKATFFFHFSDGSQVLDEFSLQERRGARRVAVPTADPNAGPGHIWTPLWVVYSLEAFDSFWIFWLALLSFYGYHLYVYSSAYKLCLGSKKVCIKIMASRSIWLPGQSVPVSRVTALGGEKDGKRSGASIWRRWSRTQFSLGFGLINKYTYTYIYIYMNNDINN